MMEEILNFVLTAGIVINTLLLFLTFKNPKQLLSRRILFFLFFFIFFICLNYYAHLHDFVILIILSFIPDELSGWLVGPLLLIYLNAIFKQEAITPKLKKHFIIPAVIFIGITLPVYIYLLTDQFQLPHIKYLMNHPSIYIFAGNLFLIVYMFICLNTWSKTKNKMGLFYSSDRAVDFKWIKYLLFGILALVFIDVFTELYQLVFDKIDWDTGYINAVSMIVLFAYLGYYGINQSNILLPDFVWENSATISSDPIETDQASQAKLLEAMHQAKPYLKVDLTLSDLAESIGITDKKLSQLLNQQMDTRFYDFINKFRLDHFVTLLQSEKLKTQTIFSLAQESGFKSKATFNRIFKKQYNCTPSKFLEKDRSNTDQ